MNPVNLEKTLVGRSPLINGSRRNLEKEISTIKEIASYRADKGNIRNLSREDKRNLIADLTHAKNPYRLADKELKDAFNKAAGNLPNGTNLRWSSNSSHFDGQKEHKIVNISINDVKPEDDKFAVINALYYKEFLKPEDCVIQTEVDDLAHNAECRNKVIEKVNELVNNFPQKITEAVKKYSEAVIEKYTPKKIN